MSWESLATHPAATTTVLAVALAVCLLAGYIYVVVRGDGAVLYDPPIPIPEEHPFLSKVSNLGLEHYLGRENIIRYYLVELHNMRSNKVKTTGYGVIVLEAHLDAEGNQLLYHGREFWSYKDTGNMRSTSFMVANDLSWYIHQLERRLVDGRDQALRVLQFHQYRNGILEGRLTFGNKRMALKPTTVGYNVLLPPGLLDIVSSMVIHEEDMPETFSMIDMEMLGSLRREIPMTRLRLKRGGEVPAEIRDTAPDGEAVMVWWLDHGTEQIIYYDSEHQIVWQQDMTRTGLQVLRAVDKKDVLAAFDDAEEQFDNWQQSSKSKLADDEEAL